VPDKGPSAREKALGLKEQKPVTVSAGFEHDIFGIINTSRVYRKFTDN